MAKAAPRAPAPRASEDETTPAQTRASAPAEDKAPRLSLQLTADESAIDFESVRPRTVEKLKRVLQHPSAERLGHKPTDPDEVLDPSVCDVLYDSLGVLWAGLAQLSGYRAPDPFYSESQKTAMRQPTAKLLDKHAGKLGPWQTEIVWGVAFVTCTLASVRQLRRLPKPTAVLRHPSQPPAPETQTGEPSQEG
jgi:hypothetical protein